jgi:hypothetical protein
MLIAVQGSGDKQARVLDAAVQESVRFNLNALTGLSRPKNRRIDISRRKALGQSQSRRGFPGIGILERYSPTNSAGQTGQSYKISQMLESDRSL